MSLNKSLEEKAAEMLDYISQNKEMFLRAWLAEHGGILPSDAVLVHQTEHVEGGVRMKCWVERK